MTEHGVSKYKYQALLITGAGIFLGTLDSSIVNVSLPTISREMRTTIDMVGWVVLSYSITALSFLMVFGALSEKKGFRFSYKAGFSIFLVGSLLCGISQHIYMLIAARVIQGFGAALLMSVGPALITRTFPASERGRGLSVNAMVVSVGLMSGPPLGGLIISSIGWRWIFFVNIPVGLLGIYFTTKYIKDLPATDPTRKTSLPGAVSLSTAFLALMLAIMLYSKEAIRVPPMLALMALSVTAWFLFFYFESRPDTRLVGLDIFKNRVFSLSGSSMLLVFVALSSVTILMPFYLEQIKNFTPDRVGFYLMTIPVSTFVMAPLAGYLADKVEARYISTLGIFLMLIGFLLIRRLGIDSTPFQIIAVLVLVGLGMGIFSTPNTSTIMGAVNRAQQGSASGIISTIRTLGMSLGVGMTIALFGIYKDRVGGDGLSEASRFVFGYNAVYGIMIFIILAAGVFSFIRGNNIRGK
jgi:EmrB/QacA subfamily drug resistance transporter